MTKRLSDEERMEEQGRARCRTYSPYSAKCRDCVQHGSFKFCRDYRPYETAKLGGLF